MTFKNSDRYLKTWNSLWGRQHTKVSHSLRGLPVSINNNIHWYSGLLSPSLEWTCEFRYCRTCGVPLMMCHSGSQSDKVK